jgi:hypothetical protein
MFVIAGLASAGGPLNAFGQNQTQLRTTKKVATTWIHRMRSTCPQRASGRVLPDEREKLRNSEGAGEGGFNHCSLDMCHLDFRAMV